MPLDGLTLGFIARELNETLTGARIERITQPEKDMLLFALRCNGKNCKLVLSASPSLPRVHLTEKQFLTPPDAPMFCMLMRKHLTFGKILSVSQMNGDRVLLFNILSQDELGEPHPYALYLEAMGRHSNLTLVRDGRIIDAIRHVTDDMSRVRQALPGITFVPPPRQDKLSPDEADSASLFARLSLSGGRLDKALSAHVAGLSAVAAREIAYRMTASTDSVLEELNLQELCPRLASFLSSLSSLCRPVLFLDENNLPGDVFPFPYFSCSASRQIDQSDLSGALESYFDGRDRRDRIQQRSADLRKLIKTHMERCEKKLALQEEELLNAAHMEDYRIMGELLNAQLYLVPRGAGSVLLDNYYTGDKLSVPLDVRLSPAQNAQKYFKRYQKARAAARLAKEQKVKTEHEISQLEEALCGLEASENENDLTDIRFILSEEGFIKKNPTDRKKGSKTPKVAAPMKYIAPDGTAIFIGKNARQNEQLTGGANGDDIWLHAKDMPGSHVIIKTEGREVSENTLSVALRFAAFYSKGRGVSVPVDVTLRKFVKKPGGTPLGFVTYTHQKTYQITVTEAEIRGLLQK